MKSSDEALRELFCRREQYYIRRRRNRKKHILLLCLGAFFLCAAAISRFHPQKADGHPQNIQVQLSEQSSGYAVSKTCGSAVQPDPDADILVINELDGAPSDAGIPSPIGDFQAMSKEEVLSHFRLKMNPSEMLPEIELTEIDRIHGFYAAKSGEAFPRDQFTFVNSDLGVKIEILLQAKGIPHIVLCEDVLNLPQWSVIGDTSVCICHWEEQAKNHFLAEFMTSTGTGITIHTENCDITAMCTLVRYFLNQSQIKVIELQPHAIQDDGN